MFGSGFRRVNFVFVALIVGTPALTWAQLPVKDVTPGKAQKVTKEEVCSGDFASLVKPATEGDSLDVYDAYAIRPYSGRELVQLIPSSLGGTNDKQNLWPLANSREFGPTQKKALDERLHKMVCDGAIELKAAQEALKKNWTDAYKKYVTTVNTF
jgi:hypothetical protein